MQSLQANARAAEMPPRGRHAAAAAGLALALMVSCTFDTSGLVPWDARRAGDDSRLHYADAAADTVLDARTDPPSDTAADGPPLDAPPDMTAPLDVLPDLMPFDAPSPDAGGMVPVAVEALSAAFWAAYVPCVNRWHYDQGYSIRIVDTAALFFLSGEVTLQDASAEILEWVGNEPSVTLVWDPNGCEYEGFSSNWTSAGLLIRKATINRAGELILDAAAGLADINMINVDDDGRYPEEFAAPDDSQLSDYQEMLNSVERAKTLILSLAQGR